MMVLLIGGIYEVCRWDGLRWHDIRAEIRDCAIVMVSLMGEIYEVRLEMISCSMICIPGFMKMVQAFKHYHGFASAA
jgi:hypothetical protein